MTEQGASDAPEFLLSVAMLGRDKLFETAQKDLTLFFGKNYKSVMETSSLPMIY